MRTVLIVDPGDADRRFLRALFSETDIRVLEAITVRQAIELVRQEAPDLIVTEFVIPERGGPCVIEALAGHVDLRGVPVIVWAMEGLGDVRARTEAQGGHFLSKSSPPLDIVRTVLSLLSGGKPTAPRAPRTTNAPPGKEGRRAPRRAVD